MQSITGYQSVLQSTNLTIAINQTTSDAISLSGTVITGLIISSALTGTELSFLASFDNENYYTLRDEAGNSITLPLNSTGVYNINEEQFVHCQYIKIVSNATELSARTIGVIVRPF